MREKAAKRERAGKTTVERVRPRKPSLGKAKAIATSDEGSHKSDVRKTEEKRVSRVSSALVETLRGASQASAGAPSGGADMRPIALARPLGAPPPLPVPIASFTI